MTTLFSFPHTDGSYFLDPVAPNSIMTIIFCRLFSPKVKITFLRIVTVLFSNHQLRHHPYLKNEKREDFIQHCNKNVTNAPSWNKLQNLHKLHYFQKASYQSNCRNKDKCKCELDYSPQACNKTRQVRQQNHHQFSLDNIPTTLFMGRTGENLNLQKSRLST